MSILNLIFLYAWVEIKICKIFSDRRFVSVETPFPAAKILTSWTCKNVQLLFLVCEFSNWKFSKAIGFISFDKMPIKMFLVKFGYCVKKDLLLVRPIFCASHCDCASCLERGFYWRNCSLRKSLFSFKVKSYLPSGLCRQSFYMAVLKFQERKAKPKCCEMPPIFKNTLPSSPELITENGTSKLRVILEEQDFHGLVLDHLSSNIMYMGLLKGFHYKSAEKVLQRRWS